MNLLSVVAVLRAKPGKEEELRQALLAVIEPTRNESGCVLYDLHVSTDDPAEFVFYEKWIDRNALQHHLEQTEHIKTLRSKTQDLLAEPPSVKTYQRLA